MRIKASLIIGCGFAAFSVIGGAATPGSGAQEASGATQAPPEQAVQAVWVPREMKFIYQGFTAHYSCDGLQGRMRELLLKLGARADTLKVYPVPCSSGFGRPDPFPGVTIKMQVLEPATQKNTVAGVKPVSAHWRSVNLAERRGYDALDATGQCELLEQVKQSVLPQFSVRAVDYDSTCVPHQLSVGGIRLKAQVLVADPPAANSQ
ncbi:MAG: hypothetical protein JSR67_12785 [Proteobacteria bacterium]|nr:hypothetical protein [Pseudomonadota bacterium]